jgi:putative nucleotidyltransferase with HDIG domain
MRKRLWGNSELMTATTKIYQGILALTAAALAVAASRHGIGNAYAVAGLAAVAAFTERGRVRLGNLTEVSISLLPTVFAAAVFGPFAAVIVAFCSLIGDFPPLVPRRERSAAFARGAPYLKWGIYSCIRVIYAATAGFAAITSGSLVSGTSGRLVVATTAAAFVAEVLDFGFVALTVVVRGGDVGGLLRMLAPVLAGAVPIYTPVVAMLAVAYSQVSPWTLALFFLPSLAAHRLFTLYQEQRSLTGQLVEVNANLERANLSFASALVTTLDARDRYTAGHSAAVAIYARDIAARMGLPEEDRKRAHLCGLVHDIGKVGLPAGLLEKPGALTHEERREMQRHSEIGERILSKVESYSEIASIVRHHHERLDGDGYPDGLTGDEIPLLSRIIAVADAYNAMTSDRPYRDAMESHIARLRLAEGAMSQFDPMVVEAFEEILAVANEEYRRGLANDFVFVVQEQSHLASVDDVRAHPRDITVVSIAAAASS